MASIKEYMEFFLRATAVPAGTKKDQEVAYATTIDVTDCNGNTVPKGNRFLAGHFPSEDVYKKFLESIAFKLNPESTANLDGSEQGLVRIAIEAATAGTPTDFVTDVHNYTTVVVPSQLPEVTAGTGISVAVQIWDVLAAAIVGSVAVGSKKLYRLRYVVTNTVVNTDTIVDNVVEQLVFPRTAMSTLSDDATDATYSVIQDHTIPLNTLDTNGDSIEYDFIWERTGAVAKTPQFDIHIGTNAIWNANQLAGTFRTNSASLDNVVLTCEVKIKITRLTSTTILCVLTSEYFNTANVSFITAVAEGKQIDVTNGGTTNVDFTTGMTVAFRVWRNGEAAAYYAADFLTIIGKVIKNG